MGILCSRLCWKNFPTLSKGMSETVLILAQIVMTFQLGVIVPSFSKEATDRGYSTALTGVFLAFIPFSKLINTLIYDFLTVVSCRKSSIRFVIVFGTLYCITYPGIYAPFCSMHTAGAIPFVASTTMAFGTAIHNIASKRAFDKMCSERKSWLNKGAKLGYLLGALLMGALYTLFGENYFCTYVSIGGSSALFLLNILMFIFLPRHVEEECQTRNYFPLLMKPKVLAKFLYMILAGMASKFLDPIIGLYASKTYDISQGTIGYIFAGWYFCNAVMPRIIAALYDRGYYYGPMLAGLFVCGMLHVLVAPSEPLSSVFPNNTQVKEAFIALNVLIGAFRPFILLSKKKKEEAKLKDGEANLHNKALTYSLMKAGKLIGQILGLIISGSLADQFGVPRATTDMAIMLFTAGAIWMICLIIAKCRASTNNTNITEANSTSRDVLAQSATSSDIELSYVNQNNQATSVESSETGISSEPKSNSSTVDKPSC